MSGRLECVYEYLQARRVTRQLEQSHDTYDAEELKDVVLLLEVGEEKVYVEGQRSDEVDHVDGGGEKVSLTGTDKEPNN